MITHQIVIHKPQIVAVPYPSHSTYHSSKKLSQEEYNEYLNELKFHEGDFITYGNVRNIPTMLSIYQVSSIETDAAKITYRYREDDPICMYLIQLSDSENPWKKWDSCVGYRSLTQEEFDQFIRPNHDHLQDYCNKHALHPKA
jgi:hypothetical protein